MLRIVEEERLITPDSSVVFDVSGFGKADHRMKQQIGLAFANYAHRNLEMSAMERIAVLKGNDFPPSESAKFSSDFLGAQSQAQEIEMYGTLHACDLSAQAPIAILVEQKLNPFVERIFRTVDGNRFDGAVGAPFFFNLHRGQHDAFGIAESDRLS